MNARQRMRDLERLASRRRRKGPSLGPEQAWAYVVGNLVRVEENQITADLINSRVKALGLPPLPSVIVSVVVREIGQKVWGSYKLYSPAEAGAMLGLTTAERTDAGIVKMDAIDEPAHARRRRLDRERKAEKRAAQAALRQTGKPKSQLIAEIADELGKSPATIYRWLKEGREECEKIRVRLSCTEGTDPRTEKFSSQRYQGAPANA